ncbi:hypothetical protein, partial [Anaerostipes hadrus]|uniref:hypothetical protein n=1 Tax=Anaerostipes hadrus TaxID=649756 RepID=UPI001EE147DA
PHVIHRFMSAPMSVDTRTLRTACKTNFNRATPLLWIADTRAGAAPDASLESDVSPPGPPMPYDPMHRLLREIRLLRLYTGALTR